MCGDGVSHPRIPLKEKFLMDTSPAVVQSSSKQSPDNQTLILNVLVGWHILLTVAAVGAAIFLWVGSDAAIWLRVILTILLLIAAGMSAGSVPNIMKRAHLGRVLSLVVNYLLLLFAFFGLLHVIGVYTGIDALAGTFGRGFPGLGVAFIGYLISAFGDRFEEDNPSLTQRFRQIGRIVMTVGAVMFLFLIGIIQGTLFLLGQLINPLALALVAGAVVSGIMIWLMWRKPTANTMNVTIRDAEMLDGLLFLSPNLLGFLFFFAGPLLLSLYVSFTDSDAFSTPTWVGLANYATLFNLSVQPLASATQAANEVLDVTIYSELTRLSLFGNHWVIGAADQLFWIALGNTLLFGLLVIPLSCAPALVLANILNSKLPGMKIYRAIYFVPSVAAVVGVALIWRWLYNSTVGWINYFITTFVNAFNSIIPANPLTDPAIGWLSDPDVALLAVAILAAWQWTGFNTVIFLAGLQGIPGDLYEAATVDGANNWAKFWSITIPMLAPTTFFVVTTTTINAMQIFDQVFVLTNPPGGPGTSTMTIVLYLYRNGFQNFAQGYASAIAWVLFLLIFGLTLVQFQRQRATS